MKHTANTAEKKNNEN